MRVINIKTYEIQIVPHDYIECSVCSEFHPPESYRNDDQEYQSRLNCKECFNLPLEKWGELKEWVKSQKQSAEYRKATKNLRETNDFEEYSVSVEDMIKWLQALPNDSKLIIREEGYYSENPIASIFSPIKDKTIEGVEYYCIGHSVQFPG